MVRNDVQMVPPAQQAFQKSISLPDPTVLMLASRQTNANDYAWPVLLR
jgi:hypothetical protein